MVVKIYSVSTELVSLTFSHYRFTLVHLSFFLFKSYPSHLNNIFGSLIGKTLDTFNVL